MIISARNSRRLQKKELENFTKFERRFRKQVRSCLNPKCTTNELSISSHHISASHLQYTSTDGRVVMFNLPSALINFGHSEPPFGKESTQGSSLTFRGFCAACDESLFIDVDNPESAFSKEIAVRQAYRTFAYQYHDLKVTYEAAKLSRRNMALVPDAFDLSKHGKVAYVLRNYARISDRFSKYSRDMLDCADNFYFQSTELVTSTDFEVPFIFSSTFPINSNFWFGKSKLFPNLNATQTDLLGNRPDDLAVLMLLKFKGKFTLSIVGPSSQARYLKDFWASIVSIDSEGILFHLLRWACVCNMGTIVSPSFWRSFQTEDSGTFRALEYFAKGIYRGEPFSWRPDITVPRLNSLRM